MPASCSQPPPDTGGGFRVRISGFRDVASTHGGAGFTDANVAYGAGTSVVHYLVPWEPGFAVLPRRWIAERTLGRLMLSVGLCGTTSAVKPAPKRGFTGR